MGFAIIISLLILGVIIWSYKEDAKRKNKSINWFIVFFTWLPFALFFGFLSIIGLHGRTGF